MLTKSIGLGCTGPTHPHYPHCEGAVCTLGMENRGRGRCWGLVSGEWLRSVAPSLTGSVLPLRNSYVRLRHLCTNTWIQSTNVPIDVEEERPIRLMVWALVHGLGPAGACPWPPADPCPSLQLGTCPTKEDKEAFAIVSVPVSEIRDLDFANDASSMLASAVEKLNDGFISQNDRRCAVTGIAAAFSDRQLPNHDTGAYY